MTDLAANAAQPTPNADVQTPENPNPSEGQAPQSHEEALYGKSPEGDKPKEGEKQEGDQNPADSKTSEGEKPSGDGEKKTEESKDAGEKKDDLKLALKLPEGSTLKAEQVDKIAEISKKRGLSNEQAQVLLESINETLPELLKGRMTEAEVIEQQKKTVETRSQAWVTEIQNDKEMGGESFNENTELARRVMHKFGSPRFLKVLNETKLGNEPELVRFCMRVGKSMGSDKFVQATKPPVKQPKSHEERLYGKKEETNE